MKEVPDRPRILSSALKHCSEEDLENVLDHPRGIEQDFPRDGIVTVVGFDKRSLPVVVLIDSVNATVFHAQQMEAKYDRVWKW